MDWSDEPASANQIQLLRHFGYEPDVSLKRGDAARLLLEAERDRSRRRDSLKGDTRKITADEASELHAAMDQARGACESGGGASPQESGTDLTAAIAKREEWWMDTCRDPGKMKGVSAQKIELYKLQGCRFEEPSRGQVREVLQALDSAAPNWERENPELFFQTMELNYRELVRQCLAPASGGNKPT